MSDKGVPPEIVREGVVAVIRREDRFLAIVRAATVIAPGKICFPGGGIEPGESEEEALIRECREELGAHILPLRRLDISVTPWKVRLRWYAARLSADAPLKPNPREVERVLWLTAGEMLRHPDALESNLFFLEKLRRGDFDFSAPASAPLG